MPVGSGPRPGSSVLELLLCVLIFVVLGLLVIPAVQKVRHLANRLECQNRLKRLGLALHMHHDRRGVFPGLGGYCDERRYLLLTRSAEPGDQERLGLGTPGTVPENQAGSWIYQILPSLDAAAASSIRGPRTSGMGLAVKDLLCPARGRPAVLDTPRADPLFAGVTYASVPPGLMQWARTDYAANGRLLPMRGQPLVRLSSVRPGLANAVLVGEKWLDPLAYASGGWLLDGPALVGGSTSARTGGRVERDHSPEPLALDTPSLDAWGSAHPSGAHFLFAGGHVQLIRHGVSEQVLQRVLGPTPSLPDFDAD